MESSTAPLLDFRGRVMFHCRACGAPLSLDDLVDLGLRLPERGESAAEYCDTELLDFIEHERCGRIAERAG